MRNFTIFVTILILGIIGCRAAEKNLLPDTLKVEYLQIINRQFQLANQAQQLQQALPKIKEEYDKLTPVLADQEAKLKKLCTEANLDFQAFPEVKCIPKTK